LGVTAHPRAILELVYEFGCDRDRMKFVIALCSLLTACAPVPRFYLQYGNDFRQSDLEKMLAENPLPPGENIKVITLGQSPAASHHVVQIRDRESPHLHKSHDATVTMLKGQGYLMLEQRRIDLTVGDVVYIPRGGALFHQYGSRAHCRLCDLYAVVDGKTTLRKFLRTNGFPNSGWVTLFEKFSNPRVAFLEAGCGWVPFWMEHMDEE
jgi:quercetin dioxygenase-like cupin family protein